MSRLYTPWEPANGIADSLIFQHFIRFRLAQEQLNSHIMKITSRLSNIIRTAFRTRTIAITTLILASCCISTVNADEIVLLDGRILHGTVLSEEIGAEETGSSIRMKVVVGSMSMIMNIQRSKISSLSYGKTPEEKAHAKITTARAALAADDSAGIWRIALELKDMKNTILFKQYARDVIGIDPTHAAAQQALARVFHDGVWMSQRDRHLALGETYFEGTWLNQDTLNEIITQREDARIAAADKRDERALARRDRRSAARAQQYQDMQYQSLLGSQRYGSQYGSRYGNNYSYGGTNLYHNYPTGNYVNRPYTPHYGHGHHHHHGGLSISASGSSGSTQWSINLNR